MSKLDNLTSREAANQFAIGLKEIVTEELGAGRPSYSFKNLIARFAPKRQHAKKNHFNIAVGISVSQPENFAADFGVNRQFFRQFALERGFQIFAFPHLAAREFPLKPVGVRAAPLADENPSALDQDACRHEDRFLRRPQAARIRGAGRQTSNGLDNSGAIGHSRHSSTEWGNPTLEFWRAARFRNTPQLLHPGGVINSVATAGMDRDLELMLRIRRGDAESFETLLARHRAPLINFFLRMVRDHALAEDLAQEVFLRVYRARDRWKPDAKFSTWLYRIAINLALNAIRDGKGTGSRTSPAGEEREDEAARLPDPAPSVAEQMMVREREHAIRAAVDSLPENQRAAVILHKYQEVDYRQIAKVLGITESAVKSLLFRAYEALRARLEPLMKEGQL